MEILAIWLTTIITSYGMEIANSLRMFKFLADAGYKIDIEQASKMTKRLAPAESEKILQNFLIPFYNIMYAAKRTAQFTEMMPLMIDQFRVLDSLEEMTLKEKEYYDVKPSGLRALMVSFESTRENKSNNINVEKIAREVNQEVNKKMGIEYKDVFGPKNQMSLMDRTTNLSNEERIKRLNEIKSAILAEKKEDKSIEAKIKKILKKK